MSTIPKQGKKLSKGESTELLRVIETRFEKNMARHKGITWADVCAKLDTQPKKMWSLSEMERTEVNRMLPRVIKRLENTFSPTALQKVRVGEEVFAMTRKRVWREKSTLQKTVR